MNAPARGKKAKYIRKIDQIEQLSSEEKNRLAPIVEKYVFRANDYYLGLIDWDDPNDLSGQLTAARESDAT